MSATKALQVLAEVIENTKKDNRETIRRMIANERLLMRMVITLAVGGQDVHTEHCCLVHGCKYGDQDCTVTKLEKSQSYLCESCQVDHY